MVKKNTLLLLAAIVWCIAGYNVAHIGITCYASYVNLLNIFLSTIIFILFDRFVFSKLVKKHHKRINEYQEVKHMFYKFFDIKSFMIMAFMITFGILIRSQALLSEEIIAIFYTGLGFALTLAGIRFAIHYIKGVNYAKRN